MDEPIFLRPGDILLYSPSSLVGVLIAAKTWTWLSHVECYVGGGRVIAARPNPGGVGIYTERLDQYLFAVRRPRVKHFDMAGAYKAVMPLMGPYEATGFFSFYAPLYHRVTASRICSPVATVWLRGGGCEPFNPDFEASDASPAQLWQSPALETVWRRNQ